MPLTPPPSPDSISMLAQKLLSECRPRVPLDTQPAIIHFSEVNKKTLEEHQDPSISSLKIQTTVPFSGDQLPLLKKAFPVVTNLDISNCLKPSHIRPTRRAIVNALYGPGGVKEGVLSSVMSHELRGLSAFQNLKSLDISNNYLTDEDLSHIPALQSLEHLGIAENFFDGSGLSSLNRFPHLESLFLGSSRIGYSPLILQELRELPVLKKLAMSIPLLPPHSKIKVVFPEITSLHLTIPPSSDIRLVFDFLLCFPQLKELDVSLSSEVQSAFIQVLATVKPPVHSLTLQLSTFEGNERDALLQLPLLKKTHIKLHTWVSSKGVQDRSWQTLALFHQDHPNIEVTIEGGVI